MPTAPTAAGARPSGTTGQWSATDLVLLDAGLAGERIVARVRVTLCAFLFVIPLYTTLSRAAAEHLVGLTISAVALAIAIALYLVLRRGIYAPWLGLATSAVDVSLVSVVLSVFLLQDTPHIAVNSRVVYEVYFIAILATCLRYDRRLCWVAGSLAIGQFAGITWFASAHWDLNSPRWSPFEYGFFDWTTQVSRLGLLFVATVLSDTIVARAKRLRQLSTLDRLTGLLNRGYFDERAEEEMSRAHRYAHSLSVALVDVDHFKLFNDTYGHAAGDAALRSIATVLRHTVRRSDIVARYGGEEFVLLFPETVSAEAAEKLEAIRAQIAATVLPIPRHSAPGRLTISVGVATWPADGETFEDVLFRADGRLFDAKRSGRNRVARTDIPAPPPPQR